MLQSLAQDYVLVMRMKESDLQQLHISQAGAMEVGNNPSRKQGNSKAYDSLPLGLDL